MRTVFAATLLLLALLGGGFHAQAASTAPAHSYVLSPDDQLSINVLGHTDLSEAVVILPDGTIRYPIIGTVHAAGMTVTELTKTLTQGLSTDLNQPEVTVTVVQTLPQRCSVLGAVHAPGMYEVKPGTHLLNILAACGGPIQDPALTKATLVSDNGAKSVTVDVAGLMNGTDPADNFPISANDVLLVQARDPSSGQVQVIGQVFKPGPYPVPVDGLTVSALLAETGGATPTGALTDAQLMHDGKTLDLNLHPLMRNLDDPVGQTLVLPGDVLLVPQDNQYIGILGEVRQPARYEIPDGHKITVSEAVMIAGGPTTNAQRNKSVIIRQQPDGKPLVIPVNIDHLLAGKGESGDMVLQPGDILYVPTLHRGGGLNPMAVLNEAPFLSYIIPHL